VTLRADGKPLDLDARRGALPAGLAAPMINRNEMTGLLLLGHKPSGGGYRPDEIELIGWAATQIGLDLHALKVEELQETAASQAHEIAVLRSLAPSLTQESGAVA
jgi:GAF domain-containing protein